MGLKSIFALMALFAYIVTASDVLELTESNFDTEGNYHSILIAFLSILSFLSFLVLSETEGNVDTATVTNRY